MDESFELPVNFNGKELLFPAQLHLFGYAPKIEIDVNGVNLMFERDEEQNWRAIVENATSEKNIPIGLFQAIVDSIEEVLK